MPRKRKKKHTLFVIFAGPQQHGRPGTRYIGKDGTPTQIRAHAARFYTFTEAQEFAKRMNIELTAMTYIGREDFTDYEVRSSSPI